MAEKNKKTPEKDEIVDAKEDTKEETTTLDILAEVEDESVEHKRVREAYIQIRKENVDIWELKKENLLAQLAKL